MKIKEMKTNFGQNISSYLKIRPGFSPEILDHIDLPGVKGNWSYTIKLITEKGNIAVYYPIQDIDEDEMEEVEEGGDYPLIMVADHYNFQYTAETMTEFESAYVKPRSTDRTLYRIKIKNIPEFIIYGSLAA